MNRRSRRPGRLALAGGILLALGLAGIAAAWTSGGPGGLTPSVGAVEIGMRYSAFSRTEVTVRAGAAVAFELRNGDPIDHEWMVGDAAFHERHRSGSEVAHGGHATEVSVPAGATATTIVTFPDPGEYLFVCHLPGHEAYGMVGVIRVVADVGS